MTTPQRPLFLARLTGTQEEMGAQHGRLTAADASRLLAFYRTMPERTLAGGMGMASKLAVRALATAWQARLARSRPPELAARSRAFAAAVAELAPGHDPRIAALTLATMDTMQNCVSLVARARLGPFARPLLARATAAAIPACSTAIVWGNATHDGELMFARNFDFPGVGVWDAAPAFIVCAPDRGQRYGFFATRGADAPVVTVVNEAGLVLAPHTRWHKDVTWGGAMIVDIVHDIARRAETIEDAIRIARERPASSSWGLAVGSARAKTAVVIELGGPNLDVLRPVPGADHVVCANVYRTETLRAGAFAGSAAWDFHSSRRERRLRTLIDGRSAPLTARDLAGFLGDRVDPAASGSTRQFGGILAQPLNVHAVVVAPIACRAWLGVDRAPTCEGTWAEIGWDWDGPAGGWELGSTAASGFTAETQPGFVAAQTPATRHVHDAVRAYESSHNVKVARVAIERAVAAEPDDPSIRLAAAWLALEDRMPDRAIVHVHAGLARETEPYRRGQLLMWGSRAAQAIDPAQARRWKDELARLSGEGVDELQARARDNHRGLPHPNLMMVDAY